MLVFNYCAHAGLLFGMIFYSMGFAHRYCIMPFQGLKILI